MYGPCMAFARLRSPTTGSVTHGHGDSAVVPPVLHRSSSGLLALKRRLTERGALASIDPTTPATKRGSKGVVPLLVGNPTGLWVVKTRKQPNGPVCVPKFSKTTPGGGEMRTGVTSGPPLPTTATRSSPA